MRTSQRTTPRPTARRGPHHHSLGSQTREDPILLINSTTAAHRSRLKAQGSRLKAQSPMKTLEVKTRTQWRRWLKNNSAKETVIWLVFYKKHTGKPCLEYDAAVEEALCFGWIDSIVKKLDEERYARKFTPRRPGSQWSQLNKKRFAAMVEQGLMTERGLAKVEEAKKSGLWDASDRPEISLEVPKELKKALAKNRKAKTFFDGLAPTYQKHFIAWIATAKRQETRDRRVSESVALLEQGKKLGLK